MSNGNYDIIYESDNNGMTIEPHFCRIVEDGKPCNGENPNHGFTLHEVAEHMADWHENEAIKWREREHSIYKHYKSQKA